MKQYKFDSERCLFREYSNKDFDNVKAIICDPETMKYYQKPYDEKGVFRWIEWSKENYQKYGFGWWAIILKDTNEFIGDCGITPQIINGNKVFELGYHLNKKYWHNGYGKEVALRCLRWYFDNTDNDELYTYTNIDNIPSRKVAESIGMKHFVEYTEYEETFVVYRIARKDLV